jgi:diguanylate cyclase (GGDEF)-like protein
MGSLLNVLLVEDSEDDYVITRDLFSETHDNGINLEWVTSYDTARERIRHRCHDVYIFDYHLGQHTGVELLEWAMEQGVYAPVILLTGQRDREIDLLAMYAGATDYLVKDRTDAALLERTVRYAYEHARRLDTLRDLAIRDGLTGLYNRREMDRLLKAEVSRCQRYGHSLGLVMIDIDNFKAINDTLGHLAGDNALRSIAHLLAEKLRSPDSIARYGGDELILILPETSESKTLLVAERLRTAVAAHDFAAVPHNGQLPRLSLTISMGVACTGDGIYTDESLFAAADLALYQAKQRGRNCIVSVGHTLLPTAPLLIPALDTAADALVIKRAH